MDHANPSLELVPAPAPVYALAASTTARDIAAVLFRRLRVMLVVFVAVLGGVAIGLTWLAPRFHPARFASSLKFIVKKDRFDAVVTPSDRAVPGLTTSVNPQEVYSEIELLRSSDVLERLAQEAGLAAPAAERLARDLVIEPVAAGRHVTNLILARYSSPDPGEVARVLSKLPEIYLQKHLSMNRRPAALEYFRSQAEASERQLRDAEQALAAFEKQDAGEAAIQQTRQKLLDQEKQRLEVEAAVGEAESKSSELGRQFEALPETVPAAGRTEASPHFDRLRSLLLDLESRRAQAIFHRDIEPLDRRLDETRQALAAQAPPAAPSPAPNPLRSAVEEERRRHQVALAGLRARLEALRWQERSSRRQLQDGSARLAAGAGRLRDLARDVQAAQENFSLYRKKYAEASEADALDQRRVLNVALAEGPRPPVRIQRRPSWFYLAFGFVFAAVAAAAAGLVVERLDHSIHSPAQLESCSRLPVLACVTEARPG